MKKYFLGVVFVLIIFCTLINTFLYAQDWEIQTLLEYAGGWLSMVMDSNNHIHVSHARSPGSNEKLYYSYFNGVKWTNTCVDYANSVGLYSDIALDNNNLPHIVYWQWGSNKWKYTYFDGQGWHITDVLTLTESGKASIRVDNNNIIHVFIGQKYLHKAVGEEIWAEESLPAGYGIVASFDIDSNNIIHAITSSHYLTYDGNSWQTEEYTDSNTNYDDIIVDANGIPHITFVKNDNIFYGKREAGNWVVEQVPGTLTGTSPSIDVDSQNLPYISYYDMFDKTFKMAHFSGTGWEISNIEGSITEEDSRMGHYSAIQIDSNDVSHVAYFLGWALCYARKIASNYRPVINVTSDSWAVAGQPFSLTITASDKNPNDIVTLDIEDIPVWLALTENIQGNPASITLSGIPEKGDIDIYTLTCTASDNQNPPRTDQEKIKIIVNEDWIGRVIDVSCGRVKYCDSIVDSLGQIHVAYATELSSYTNQVRYGIFNGVEWQFQLISFDNCGTLSIACDSLNQPHIICAGDKLKHFYYDQGRWYEEILDDSCIDPNISIDARDNIHLVYCKSSSIMYACYDGRDWTYIHLKDGVEGLSSLSSAIDSENNLHFIYSYQTGDVWNADRFLAYAIYNGNLSQEIVIDDRPGSAKSASITIDTNNLPHIVYYNSVLQLPAYAHYNGQEWIKEDIYPPNTTAYDYGAINVVSDRNDNIHVSLYHRIGGNYGLYYALRKNGKWFIEDVDVDNNANGYANSLVIKDDKPYILYSGFSRYTSGKNNLRFAERVYSNHRSVINEVFDQYFTVGHYKEFAISAFDVDSGDSVNFNINNLPTWLSIVDSSSGNPASVTIGGTPTINDLHTVTSIDVSAADNGIPERESSLNIELNVNEEWLYEVVNVEVGSMTYPAISVDAANNIHLVYRDNNHYSLIYAFNNGDSWNRLVLLIDTNSPNWPRIAIDGNNNPGVAFSTTFTYDGLKYAHLNSGRWQVEDIGAPGNRYANPSLDFDSLNRPHIAFYDSDYNIKYAFFDGNGWQITTVDPEAYSGGYISLKIDSHDRPCIAYDSQRPQSIRYASFDGVNWDINVIDNLGCVGPYNFLALDSSDTPHVAYYNTESRDIYHAYLENGIWNKEIVMENVDSVEVSICMSRDDNVYIMKAAGYSGHMASLIYRNGDMWTSEPVGDYPGNYFDFSLDCNNMPVVSFVNEFGTLMVARKLLNNNHAPIADNQLVSANEDTSVAITLTGSDPDGDPLIYSIVTQPLHGTLSGTPPSVTYTPALNYNGADSFTFKVNDGYVYSNIATVSITVNPVNDPPIANGQSVTTAEDTSKTITLTGSDPDGDTLTFNIYTQPAHGTISGTPPNITYTPAVNYNGSDSFTFRAYDGSVYSSVATVSITVTPVNDPPVANAQSVSTNEDTAKSITLTGSDPDGNPLTYTIVSQPVHGTLTGTPPSVTYTPALNYNGADSFTFKVNDGYVDSNIATVSITVNPVNDPPVANAQSVSTNEDTAKAITLTGSDPEGSSLTYSIVTNPSHGTLSGTAPNVTYTPALNYNGADSFTFKVYDGYLYSSPATVSITVNPVNDPPVANPQSVVTSEDVAKSITLTGSDPEGSSLTYSIVTQPSHGTLTGTLPSVTYTPVQNYNGSDSFTFKVYDGSLYSSPATVSITINPVNDAPVLAPIGNKSVNENQLLTFALSATDMDGDTLTFSATGLPSGAVLNPTSGVFSWTPTGSQVGTHTITFTVTDSGSPQSSDSETITITVINLPPPTPKNLKATVVQKKVQLKWGTVSDPNLKGYNVYRAKLDISPSPGPGIQWIKIKTVNVNYYTDTPGSGAYYYKVNAVDKFGLVSGFSNIVSVKVPSGPTPTP